MNAVKVKGKDGEIWQLEGSEMKCHKALPSGGAKMQSLDMTHTNWVIDWLLQE